MVAKEVTLIALQRGIRIHQYPPNLSPAYTDLGSSLSRGRLAGEQGEIRTGSKTSFQLSRLPIRPERGQGQTHTRMLAGLNNQDSTNIVRFGVPGLAIHVLHRFTHCNRETSPPRLAPYKAHTVGLEEQLEGTRVTKKSDPHTQIALPSSEMVAGGKQCASKSTITPTKICSADLYRCIKRVGRSLIINECTASGT